jgi:segregation and condensation protein B
MMRGDTAGDVAHEVQPGPGLRACLEAILLVVDEPVAEVVLAQVLERPREEIALELADLAASYAAEGRGFDLREVAGGWRFYTREECAPVVERFVRDGQEVRLTQAALETLAVVAYRQPVSRARVSAVRGVNCDGVMRTLTLRGLVEEAGTEHETGAILYRTTGYFLERLGLASLDELPALAPFLPDQIEDSEGAGEDAPDTAGPQNPGGAADAGGVQDADGAEDPGGAGNRESARGAQDVGDASDEHPGP